MPGTTNISRPLKLRLNSYLQTAAAFRAPVDYMTFAALFVQRHQWSPQRLDVILTDLEDRGLLGWDRGANRYDLHPVVREVVWNNVDDVRRQALYGQVEQAFSSTPAVSAKALSVEEALPVIELIGALIGLSRYEDASNLYFDRLHGVNGFSFAAKGMGHVNIALLESFFPDGLERLHEVRRNRERSIIAQLGHAYQAAGRLSDAHRCAIRNIEDFEPADIRPLDYRHVSQLDLRLGRLRSALEQAQLAAGSNDKHAMDHLALCEAIVGRYDEALPRLAGLKPDNFYDPRLSETRIWLWIGEFERAADLGRQALPSVSYIVRRLALMTDIAEADLYLGHLHEATDTLINVLREARLKALAEAELHSLCRLADAYRLHGDDASARTFLDELDEIAARGPYRLVQADAANIRARLSDADTAQRLAHAEHAYRLAWCDGEPYAYRRALELAAQALRDLGAPPPQPAA